MVAIGIVRRQIVEFTVTGICAQTIALVLHGSTVENEVEVKVLVATAEGKAKLERRVSGTPGVVNIFAVNIAVAIAVFQHILTHDEATVTLLGTIGGIKDLAGVGLVHRLETASGPVIGVTTHVTVPTVQIAVLPIVHGRSVNAGVLALNISITGTGEGSGTLDTVREVTHTVAVVQAQFQTLGLVAVQVLLRKGYSIEVRQRSVTGGSSANHLTPEPVKGTAELTLPHFPVHTEVHHTDLSPGKEGVGHLAVGITRGGGAIREYPGTASSVAIDIGIGRALRCTGETIGPAELEVVHKRQDVLEEFFFRDTPTQGVGREQAPTLASLEHVVTIVTAHQFHKVLALVVVIETGNITGRAAGGTGTLVLGTGRKALVDHIVSIKVVTTIGAIIAGCANHGIGDAGQFRAHHGGHIVCTGKLAVVHSLETAIHAGVVIPHLGVLGLLTGLKLIRSHVRIIIIQLHLLNEGALLATAKVISAGNLELQTFQERSVISQIDGIGEILTVGLGVTGSIGIEEGNGVRVLFHVRIVLRVVLGVNTHHRIGLIDIIEDIPVHIKVTHTQVGALANTGGITQGQVGMELDRNVAIEAVTLVTIGVTLQDRVIVGIVGTEIVVDSLSTTGDGKIVQLVNGNLLVHLIVPVGVYRIIGLAANGIRIGRKTFFVCINLNIRETMGHIGHVRHGIFPLHERSPAFNVAGNNRGSQGNIGREVDGRLLDLSLLGGDEDHTILGAQTVDGSGSVLQDRDAFNVFGVQLLENGHIRIGLKGIGVSVVSGRLTGTGCAADHTVNNDHRGTKATEVDLGGKGTGLAAVLGDEKARDLTLEGSHTVSRLGGGNILCADLGDSAREGFLLLDAVTHDHGLVQELGVFDQDNIHLGRCLERTGFKTDGRELEDGTLGNGEFEVTVNVGGRTGGGTLLHNGSSDNRFLLRICDRTGHLDGVLRKQRRGTKEDSQYQRRCTHEQIAFSHVG